MGNTYLHKCSNDKTSTVCVVVMITPPVEVEKCSENDVMAKCR